MRKRFLNLTLALGLVTGLLVGAVGTASAETPVGSDNEWIFFPWVANGEELAGDGPWYGTVTIQNVEQHRIWISFGDTAGGVTPNLTTTLEPFASKTFSAAQLGVAEPGGAVAVKSSWYYDANANIFPDFCAVEGTVTETVKRGNTANTADPLATSNIADVVSVVAGAVTYLEGDDFIFRNGMIDWSPSGAEPSAGTSYTVTLALFDCLRGPEIAAVEKHVMPVASASGKTNEDHIAVSGYTGIPDEDTAWGPASAFCHDVFFTDCNALGAFVLGIPLGPGFDGHSYLPIVQNNWNGWETVIHVANIDASSPSFASYTITLYPADSQGAGGPSVGSFTGTLAQGEAVAIPLSDIIDDLEFVGSAWITSDYGLVANADRVKPETEMAVTNTSAPSLLAITSPGGGFGDIVGADEVGSGFTFEMYAPLVFKDYLGWSTGINVANISEFSNTVNVVFYGPTGNVVGSDQRTISPKGMEYIYMPARDDLGIGDTGFVGAAVLSSPLPFHAAVDEVKYSEGEAMSYIATAVNVEDDDPTPPDSGLLGAFPRLALPLVQKGSPFTGLGDTSGINLFNADADDDVDAAVAFFQPSGALAAPTLGFPVYQITLGPLNTATIYTMDFSEMSAGFQGSAIIAPLPSEDGGEGDLVGVSNNVNYDIAGDGSTVFNLVNTCGQFRFMSSQTAGFECGFDGDFLLFGGIGNN